MRNLKAAITNSSKHSISFKVRREVYKRRSFIRFPNFEVFAKHLCSTKRRMKSQRISIASNQENAKVCAQRVLCWRLWTKFISNDDERRVLVAWTIKQLFISLNFVHFLQESIAGKGNKINSKNMATDRRKSNENAKRQAEESPNNAPTRKRSALGDMTNVRWYWVAASA